jgi:thiosulfate/3-mercaptopyruvate sulfurtransferase
VPLTAVLISVPDLAERIAAGRAPRLLDVRWALGGPPGAQEFLAGHLPGAVFADLDADLAAPAAPGAGRHPLPDVRDLQAAARSWGIRDGDTVVAYDNSGGLAAARAWWLLRWAGLGDVLLLDGGLSAWRAAGHPVTTQVTVPDPGDVTLTGGHLPVADPDDVAELIAGGALVLDARAAERYRGEPNPIDPQFGHIPGAVSAPATETLDAAGAFRSAAELAARFEALGVRPGRTVAVYCGSGVTAAHQIAALALAGVDDAVLYPGSWSQWATLPDRPIATGPEPS